MISFTNAQELLKKLAADFLLLTEKIKLEHSLGRITAEDVTSTEVIPAFDNSSMDGFAIKSQLTQLASIDNPIEFEVLAEISAGDDLSKLTLPRSKNTSHFCVQIMTGAQIPEGFDAIVKIEDVSLIKVEDNLDKNKKKSIIKLNHPVLANTNLRKAGDDYQLGQSIVGKNKLINLESMMAFAALGKSLINVYQKINCSIIATGKELVSFKEKNIANGMIRNSSSIYLKNSLEQLGCHIAHKEMIQDDEELFKLRIQSIANDSLNNSQIDLVITTGAVSMGSHDFVKKCLLELGAEIIFHKVAIKPGKPILVAKLKRNKVNGRPVFIFSMPGNPISTAVALRFFLTPFLRHVFHQDEEIFDKAKLVNEIEKPGDLQVFLKAIKVNDNAEKLKMKVLNGQASFMISTFVTADAWVIMSDQRDKINAGEDVIFAPLTPSLN